MNIQLYQPYALHEVGRRSNNEDNIYPKKGDAVQNNSFFVVCDGVGGAAKGEEASRIVCETFAKVLGNGNEPSDEAIVNSIVGEAEVEIDNYVHHNPYSRGMATTLTFLHFHTEGVTVAHAGDSRIYQVRNGAIIHQTEDHSFVNELVRGGHITKEDAAKHPKRNVITRAIQGTERRTRAEVVVLQDVQKGDYFFMCTDGILEQISDDLLGTILGSTDSDETKINTIFEQCYDKTKDNFSCYLVGVKDVEGAGIMPYKGAGTVFYVSDSQVDSQSEANTHINNTYTESQNASNGGASNSPLEDANKPKQPPTNTSEPQNASNGGAFNPSFEEQKIKTPNYVVEQKKSKAKMPQVLLLASTLTLMGTTLFFALRKDKPTPADPVNQSARQGEPTSSNTNTFTPSSHEHSPTPQRHPVTPSSRPSSQHPVTPSSQQPITPSTEQPVTPSTEQPVTPSKPQPVTPSNQQPVTPNTQQPVTPNTQQTGTIKGEPVEVKKDGKPEVKSGETKVKEGSNPDNKQGSGETKPKETANPDNKQDPKKTGEQQKKDR
jgi:protein phosphatase